MAELPQGLVLDLANPLTGDVEGASDLFKSVLGSVADAESEFEDLFFPRCQGLEDGIGVVLQCPHDHGIDRRDRCRILDEVTEV